jgi:hypothetical protein
MLNSGVGAALVNVIEQLPNNITSGSGCVFRLPNKFEMAQCSPPRIIFHFGKNKYHFIWFIKIGAVHLFFIKQYTSCHRKLKC